MWNTIRKFILKIRIPVFLVVTLFLAFSFLIPYPYKIALDSCIREVELKNPGQSINFELVNACTDQTMKNPTMQFLSKLEYSVTGLVITVLNYAALPLACLFLLFACFNWKTKAQIGWNIIFIITAAALFYEAFVSWVFMSIDWTKLTS